MAVREIPASYEYVCDGCKKATTTPTKIGRPPYWATLAIEQNAYDYQGCAVADGTIRRLLCRDCTEAASKAINETIALRSLIEEPTNDAR